MTAHPRILTSLEVYIMTNGYTAEIPSEAVAFVDGKPASITYKATEQYLDAEDRKWWSKIDVLYAQTVVREVTVLELLSALEDLRNHLRGKYYGG